MNLMSSCALEMGVLYLLKDAEARVSHARRVGFHRHTWFTQEERVDSCAADVSISIKTIEPD